MSTPLYIRARAGHDQRASPQVLDALARALQLQQQAAIYAARAGATPATTPGPPPAPLPLRGAADHVMANRRLCFDAPRRARGQPDGDRARAVVHRRQTWSRARSSIHGAAS